MWKKYMKYMLFCGLLVLLAGCGQKDAAKTAESTTQANALDVDLTILSSTMVYSEVNQMMTTPDDYLGKMVKMKGTFTIYQENESSPIYYACLISDATSCCSQGIEFVLKDEKNYPDDYPELGSEITVTGTFDTYEEGEYRYCRLIDAVME